MNTQMSNDLPKMIWETGEGVGTTANSSNDQSQEGLLCITEGTHMPLAWGPSLSHCCSSPHMGRLEKIFLKVEAWT